MRRLRELLNGINEKEEQLADNYGVTSKDIDSWEAGEAEPSLIQWRDLALLFSTSVSKLREFDRQQSVVSTNHLIYGSKLFDGYWGHVGLLLPVENRTTWYPITEEVAQQIETFQATKPWMVIDTLNDKRLLISYDRLPRITLLPEACDGPDGDWELVPDGYMGCAQEIYNCIEQYYEDPEQLRENCSAGFYRSLEEFIASAELSADDYMSRLNETSVYTQSGMLVREQITTETMGFTCEDVDMAEIADDVPVRVMLETVNGARHAYLSKEVCFIEMPLHELLYLESEW